MPRTLWEGGRHPALREALLRAGSFVASEPLWLQDSEPVDDYLFQVDDRLVDMNLGDSGALYVFERTAFRQSL